MEKKISFFTKYKSMIIMMGSVIIVFVPLKMFDLFDISSKLKDVVELLALLFAIYQADKSQQSVRDIEFIEERIRNETIKSEKQKKLYIRLSKDIEMINSYTARAIVFLTADINDKVSEAIVLSTQFLDKLQELISYLNYYEDIIEDKIINSKDNICSLVDVYINSEEQDESKSIEYRNAIKIKEELLSIKRYMDNIIIA